MISTAALIVTMQARIETMGRQFDERNELDERYRGRAYRFVQVGIDGTSKDLVEEIFGKNFVKWQLNITAFLFTEQELILH